MTGTAAGFLDSLLGRASCATDVVVLGGDAARAVAADFARDLGSCRQVGEGRPPWLAVASQAGRVVGLAVAHRDVAGLQIVDLLTSEVGDRELITERLISALAPLARGRTIGLSAVPGDSGVLGLRERRN